MHTHPQPLYQHSLISLPSWLAAVKSTQLYFNHILHIHREFHCTVTVLKVAACCRWCFRSPLTVQFV